MRILTFLLLVIATSFVNAQIIISDKSMDINNIPNVNNDKSILSFETNNMGIILPIIKASAETSDIIQPGAIFVSAQDKRVKIYNKAFNSKLLWLTNPTSGIVPVDTSNENTNINDFIVGDQTNTKKGVLVLEDVTKTLLLPTIGNENRPPHKYIKNPYIGTIGFADTKNYTNPNSTLKKFIWVYGGSGNGPEDNEWNLWRAGVEISSINVSQAYLDELPNTAINPTTDLLPEEDSE